MAAEADILEPVRQSLAELLKRPVQAEITRNEPDGPDAIFIASPHTLVVEARVSNRVATVHIACQQAKHWAKRQGGSAIPLLAVPYMGPAGRRECQKAGVSFADAAGNAHIEAPGLYVHVEGKPDRRPARGRPASVFAPRSSRVARLLLLDPSRAWQQIEIAREARIGRGFVSRIVARLAEDALVAIGDDGRVRTSSPDLLLDAWREEYNFAVHRVVAGHIASRSGEELAERFATFAREHDFEYAFTGLPAAAKLAPFASFRLMAAYVPSRPGEKLLQALGFHHEERGANTWLIIPKDEGVFDGAQEIAGQRCVSAVQTYLDLQSMPERAKEAAHHLRSSCLNWR